MFGSAALRIREAGFQVVTAFDKAVLWIHLGLAKYKTWLTFIYIYTYIYIYGCYAKGPCKRFVQNDLSSQEPMGLRDNMSSSSSDSSSSSSSTSDSD